MLKHVMSFALFGVLAFVLFYLNPWAPMLLVVGGALLCCFGGSLDKFPDFQKLELEVHGMLAISAGLAGMTFEGMNWFWAFALVMLVVATIFVSARDDRREPGIEFRSVRTIVALALPLAGLLCISSLPEVGFDRFVNGMLFIAIFTAAGGGVTTVGRSDSPNTITTA